MLSEAEGPLTSSSYREGGASGQDGRAEPEWDTRWGFPSSNGARGTEELPPRSRPG